MVAGGGGETSFPPGQASGGQEFGSKCFFALPLPTQGAGRRPPEMSLAWRCPAPCELGEQSRYCKGAERDAGKKRSTNSRGKSAPAPPGAPQRGASARKTIHAQLRGRELNPPSAHSRPARGWSISTASPGILPAPHHGIPAPQGRGTRHTRPMPR